MKIALSTSSAEINSSLDPRFGRAATFQIFDGERQEFLSVDNSPQKNATQGAGIQVAQMLVDLGVEAVITGHCGPKAFLVLNNNHVQVYTTKANTVTEALDLFEAGKLPIQNSSDTRGHSS